MRSCRTASLATLALTGLLAPRAWAQPQTIIAERLDPSSVLIEHLCRGPCACAPRDVSGTISGRFTLVRTAPDPLFERYNVVNVRWIGHANGQDFLFIGSGTYREGGEVARVHQLTLDLSVNGSTPQHFDSGLVVATGRAFPHIDIDIQTPMITCTVHEIDVRSSRTCRSDWDDNLQVAPADVALFVSAWFQSLQNGTLDGDFDASGVVAPADVGAFINAWFGDIASDCTV